MNFTPELLKKLKLAYKQALADKKEQFTFEKTELLTSYAKYLIEHLNNVMKIKP